MTKENTCGRLWDFSQIKKKRSLLENEHVCPRKVPEEVGRVQTRTRVMKL